MTDPVSGQPDQQGGAVGCCDSCGGTGGDSDGPCWDCRGTGCAHPDPCHTAPEPGTLAAAVEALVNSAEAEKFRDDACRHVVQQPYADNRYVRLLDDIRALLRDAGGNRGHA